MWSHCRADAVGNCWHGNRRRGKTLGGVEKTGYDKSSSVFTTEIWGERERDRKKERQTHRERERQREKEIKKGIERQRE